MKVLAIGDGQTYPDQGSTSTGSHNLSLIAFLSFNPDSETFYQNANLGTVQFDTVQVSTAQV